MIPWNKGRKETRPDVLKRQSLSHVGKKHTEAQKIKISEKGIGRIVTQETRDKISKARTGIKRPPFSAEWRRKLGLASKGIKRSLEFRKKVSDSKKGSKSHLWQGGKTAESKIIRESWEYRLWRENVFKRDNWTCQICKKRGVRLNADHIKPFSKYPEFRFDLNNGRTLCISCHRKTDTFGVKSVILRSVT